MYMLKQAISAAMAAALILTAFSGCKGDTAASSSSSSSKEPDSGSSAQPIPLDYDDASLRKDDGKEPGYQLDMPAEGEEIAVLTTDAGVIKIRLFPEAAPKTVENFKGLIQKGYYDGVTFHRAVKDFMIQGGDPKGTGLGGESFFGKAFDDEFNSNLMNLRGALSMANTGAPGSNTSQFFIVQSSKKLEEGDFDKYALSSYLNGEIHRAKLMLKQKENSTEAEYKSYMDQLNASISKLADEGVPADREAILKKAAEQYNKVGGTPDLDYKHTVFGQVFEGLDIVDNIAGAEVTDNGQGEKSKPVKPAVITKAEIQTYKAN